MIYADVRAAAAFLKLPSEKIFCLFLNQKNDTQALYPVYRVFRFILD